MNLLKKHFLISLCALSVASCTSDDPEPDNNKSDWSGYVVGLRATDGEASADYLMTVDDLMTGVISSTGNGEEQAGWSYYTAGGGKFFSIGYTLNECIAYSVEEGELAIDSKFVFERIDCMNPLDDTHFLGIGAPWGGGSYNCQLQVIDIASVSISKTVNHPIYESYYFIDSVGQSVQLNAWPTDSHVQDDKLFVSFYPLHGVSWETPLMDTAYISIYSYPELEYIKTIKDARTGPIGYYGSQPALLETENGDVYTLSSSSYMAGYTHATKPSGILRINANEDEFDQDYFFDIENEYGFKVLNAVYAGDGKAVARVTESAQDQSKAVQWAAFGNYFVVKLVVIDLENRTLTEVANMPIHAGQYQTPYYIEEGKVYLSVRSTEGTFVYKVDPETASAEKGAKIEGIELQAIFKSN